MLNLSKSPPSPSYHLPSPATFRRPSPNRPTLTLFRYSASLLTKRYCRLLFLTLFAISFLFFLLKLSPPPSFEPLQLIRIPAGQDLVLIPPPYPSPPTDEQRKGLPPLFEAWKEYERALPQHAADNGTTRFIYMKNHVVASGWGNVLQEMILNTHLAFLSGRSFVFDNYTWDRSTSEYSSFNGKTIPSRVPVSTMLAGPIIGGSFDLTNLNDPFFTVDPSSTSHPRAVSSEYYERVCDGQKKIVDTAIVRNAVESWDGKANLEAWVKYLQDLPDRCVEFDINAQHIFHIWMFGSPKVLTLWPSLSESPILRQFTHSPLILAAFERHRHLFGVVDTKPAKPKGQLHFVPSLGTFLPDVLFPRPRLDKPQVSPAHSASPSPSSSSSPASPNSSLSLVDLNQIQFLYPHSPARPNINDTIPGLLVLHVRRGDFDEHCVHLVKYSSTFNGFNSFEDMRDQDGFDPAAAGGGAEPPGDEPTAPEGEEAFASRIEGLSKEEKDRARKARKDALDAYSAARNDYEARAAKYETAKANYLERCFPNVSQIVKRVRQVRERVARAPSNLDSHSHRTSSSLSAPLTHLYIMTNGKPPFLAELRAALELDAITHNPFDLPPWESIYTSRDLELGWEEGYVAQALDMYVAQRAEVFIGNGFSSLTSNIVMLRKANGVDTIKTRLW
ncbi:hypothetical protein EV361DRAFT_920187 [Lentinula raphanica]|uniref:Uncharacterized protein n=1 Tax=Lentinula raphanica TaxID=153919 RepID=A0AA38P5X6_9AGAR|nr:hypothetical protein F5878DRAFT_623867 [Lentinula raphanica]KAJ3969586.1 hypothetical protein EV361DRAFT_920187 [Lentinula raphanica]